MLIRQITGVIVLINVGRIFEFVIFSDKLTYIVVIITYLFAVTIPYLSYIALVIVSIGICSIRSVYGR